MFKAIWEFSDFFSKDKKDKLDKGLEKSKESIVGKLSRAVAGKSKVDEDFLDNLEEILISADVGVATTVKIIERLEERVARDKFMNIDELNSILKEEISALFDLGEKSNPAFMKTPRGKFFCDVDSRGEWCWQNDNHWKIGQSAKK